MQRGRFAGKTLKLRALRGGGELCAKQAKHGTGAKAQQPAWYDKNRISGRTVFGAGCRLRGRPEAEGAKSQRNQRLTGIGFRFNIIPVAYFIGENDA
jgi:hypothetical protein